MFHILVAGAGYAGCAVAAHFRSKNQKVWALSRSGQSAAFLNSIGATPIRADLLDPASLAALPPAHFIVIGVAPQERSARAYRETYLDGVRNLLERISKNPRPSLIVYLSSTGVYRDFSGAWVDEETPPEPDTELGRILLEAEAEVLSFGLPAAVFRLGGIYGPGRDSTARLREGSLGGSDGYVNLIHVEDIAAAMPALFNKAREGEVYLGVDDEPVLRSRLYGWLAGRTGLESPRFSEGRAGRRCSNRKLKSLGFTFTYPDFRAGYDALWKSAALPE